MRHTVLSMSVPDFHKVLEGSKTLELRSSGYDTGPALRREFSRPRPSVGDYVTIHCPKKMSHAPMKRVDRVRTVAIYCSEDHPLWINGKPVRHVEQEAFAKLAGFQTWADFAFSVAIKYGSEFDGYSVEFK